MAIGKGDIVHIYTLAAWAGELAWIVISLHAMAGIAFIVLNMLIWKITLQTSSYSYISIGICYGPY